MMHANLLFAWAWILTGLLSGIAFGLFFHREDWLGGYASWPRRMLRLGHIAFFGTGLLNLLAAISMKLWVPSPSNTLNEVASALLIVGAITMSLVCFLAAWKKPFRNLFFIPVVSLVGGVATILLLVVAPTLRVHVNLW